ncbi:MAG: DNA repair protein RecO [Lachnospiraceae bacterium]|nr:DNA repair protein RecO [Lachnospiraceae bacterium]
MSDILWTPGMVLRVAPANEYDRRVVLLTKDHGRITAFAKGARRQTNHLMAATDLFVFADFKLFPGRSAYSLLDAGVKNYFSELRQDFEAACLGSFFLELAEYNSREDNDERDLLALLYQSCRALIHPAYEKSLLRAVFELKLMMLQGSFHRQDYGEEYSSTALYTLDFLLATAPEKIFSFSVKPEVVAELSRIALRERRVYGDGHVFRSEELLEGALGGT